MVDTFVGHPPGDAVRELAIKHELLHPNYPQGTPLHVVLGHLEGWLKQLGPVQRLEVLSRLEALSQDSGFDASDRDFVARYVGLFRADESLIQVEQRGTTLKEFMPRKVKVTVLVQEDVGLLEKATDNTNEETLLLREQVDKVALGPSGKSQKEEELWLESQMVPVAKRVLASSLPLSERRALVTKLASCASQLRGPTAYKLRNSFLAALEEMAARLPQRPGLKQELLAFFRSLSFVSDETHFNKLLGSLERFRKAMAAAGYDEVASAAQYAKSKMFSSDQKCGARVPELINFLKDTFNCINSLETDDVISIVERLETVVAELMSDEQELVAESFKQLKTCLDQ